MCDPLAEQLSTHIRTSLARYPVTHDARALTVGVEHECFLHTNDGDVADHAASQRLFAAMADEPGWAVHGRSEGPLGPMLDGASRDLPGGRYTVLKYDHHPHLLEVAFAWHTDLIALHEEVATTLGTLARVATGLGLRLGHTPFLDLPASDPRLVSPLPAFQTLRHTRARLFARRGEPADVGATNYAAVIAATQTHIGGVPWIEDFGLIEALYRLEPDWQQWTCAGLASDATARASLIARRFAGYLAAFRGQPLVGFPTFETCTFSSWIEALLDAALAGAPGSPSAAHSARELGGFPDGDLARFVAAVRDLAVIRPRVFGTIEFRGDPAQPSAAAIVSVAALRLAACVGVMSGARPRRTLAQARKAWHDAHRTAVLLDPAVLSQAATWLALRGRGEERFLPPLERAA